MHDLYILMDMSKTLLSKNFMVHFEVPKYVYGNEVVEEMNRIQSELSSGDYEDVFEMMTEILDQTAENLEGSWYYVGDDGTFTLNW